MKLRIDQSIKLKLQFAFSIFILCIGVLCGVFYYYLQRLNSYHSTQSKVDELLVQTLQARKYETDFIMFDSKNSTFMASGKSDNLTRYAASITNLRKILQELKAHAVVQSMDLRKDLQKVENHIQQYNMAFNVLADKVRQRGFKDYGMEGDMRKAVHSLEENGGLAKADLLTLRRHEKDFIIRKDVAYSKKLHDTAEELMPTIEEDNMKAALTGYVNSFDKMVSLEKEIGLTDNGGLKGKIQVIVQDIEPIVEGMHRQISTQVDGVVASLNTIITTVSLLMVLGVIGFGIYFTYSISKPIETLDRITQSVVKGLKNQDELLDKIKVKDEIGSLARNFKAMLQKLKTTLDEANQQNQQLEAIAREEAKRNWSREGLSQLGDTLRVSNQNLEEKANALLSQLIRYLNANQGAFYITGKNENQEEVMQMKACYAYGKKKFRITEIEMGEGLVGQAWQEKDTIFITAVPQSFVQITSGLGEAKPTCVLIIPIMTDQQVEGVLEMVSFKVFEPHEIEFVKRFASQAANTITAVKMNEVTKILLEQAEKMAEELKEKEAALHHELEEYHFQMSHMKEERQKLEDDLQVFHSMMSQMNAGVIVTDENFNILNTNEITQQVTHFADDEMIGKPLSRLIHLIDQAAQDIRINGRFTPPATAHITDRFGKDTTINLMSSKVELARKAVHTFVFSEIANPWQNPLILEEIGNN
jgi:PAS domain S-box-containing protein